MNTDSHYIIGHSHKICEDYTLNFDKCIIVCDGCSSSNRVDVGARILAHTAVNNINHFNSDQYEKIVINQAKNIIDILKLSNYTLDSTLLVSLIDDGKCYIKCFGDGFVIFKNKNSNIELYQINYDDNSPFYLSYLIDNNRYNMYANKNPRYQITQYKVENNIYELVNSESKSYIEPISITKDINDLDFVILSSDGIGSIIEMIVDGSSKYNKDINVSEIIYDLCDFKSTTGNFVQRRLIALKQKMNKMNRKNIDDISLAAIYVGDEANNKRYAANCQIT